jgi:imidazoleglycerol-phosphate dehydratase
MRRAALRRKTKETSIRAALRIEGRGAFDVKTPVGFLTHMLESFALHGRFDLDFRAEGDLHVDQHHLIEDCGIVLGRLFAKALGRRRGINRAGYFVYPMDDALAVVAVDLGGRPFLVFDARFRRRFCGDLDTDLLEEFFRAFSRHAGANLHVKMPYGKNDHHRIEAIFKAFARAMKMACSTDPAAAADVPSTKGLLEKP